MSLHLLSLRYSLPSDLSAVVIMYGSTPVTSPTSNWADTDLVKEEKPKLDGQAGRGVRAGGAHGGTRA